MFAGHRRTHALPRWLQWGVALCTLLCLFAGSFVFAQSTELTESTRRPGFGYCTHTVTGVATAVTATWNLFDTYRTTESLDVTFPLATSHGTIIPTAPGVCTFSKKHAGATITGPIASDFILDAADVPEFVVFDLKEANMDSYPATDDFDRVKDVAADANDGLYGLTIVCQFTVTDALDAKEIDEAELYSPAYVNGTSLSVTDTTYVRSLVDKTDVRMCDLLLTLPAVNLGQRSYASYATNKAGSKIAYEYVLRDVPTTVTGSNAFNLHVSSLPGYTFSADCTDIVVKYIVGVGAIVTPTVATMPDTAPTTPFQLFDSDASGPATALSWVYISFDCPAPATPVTDGTFTVSVLPTPGAAEATDIFGIIERSQYMGLERLAAPTVFKCNQATPADFQNCLSWNPLRVAGLADPTAATHTVYNEIIRPDFGRFAQEDFYADMKTDGLSAFDKYIKVGFEMVISVGVAEATDAECRIGHSQFTSRSLFAKASDDGATITVSTDSIELYQYGGLSPLFVQCVVYHDNTPSPTFASTVSMWTNEAHNTIRRDLRPVLPAQATAATPTTPVKYFTAADSELGNDAEVNILVGTACGASAQAVLNMDMGASIVSCQQVRYISRPINVPFNSAQFDGPATNLFQVSTTTTHAPACTTGSTLIHYRCQVAAAPTTLSDYLQFSPTKSILSSRPIIASRSGINVVVRTPLIGQSLFRNVHYWFSTIAFDKLGNGGYTTSGTISGTGGSAFGSTGLTHVTAGAMNPASGITYHPAFASAVSTTFAASSAANNYAGFAGVLSLTYTFPTGVFAKCIDTPGVVDARRGNVFYKTEIFFGTNQVCDDLFPVYTQSSLSPPSHWNYSIVLDVGNPVRVGNVSTITLPYFFHSVTKADGLSTVTAALDMNCYYEVPVLDTTLDTPTWSYQALGKDEDAPTITLKTNAAPDYSAVKLLTLTVADHPLAARSRISCSLKTATASLLPVQSVVPQRVYASYLGERYVRYPEFMVDTGRFNLLTNLKYNTAAPSIEVRSPTSVGFSTIFPSVNALTRCAFVAAVSSTVGSDNRKIFVLTDADLEFPANIRCTDGGDIVAGLSEFVKTASDAANCADQFYSAGIKVGGGVVVVPVPDNSASRLLVCADGFYLSDDQGAPIATSQTCAAGEWPEALAECRARGTIGTAKLINVNIAVPGSTANHHVGSAPTIMWGAEVPLVFTLTLDAAVANHATNNYYIVLAPGSATCGLKTSLPLEAGATAVLVAKVVAHCDHADMGKTLSFFLNVGGLESVPFSAVIATTTPYLADSDADCEAPADFLTYNDDVTFNFVAGTGTAVQAFVCAPSLDAVAVTLPVGCALREVPLPTPAPVPPATDGVPFEFLPFNTSSAYTVTPLSESGKYYREVELVCFRGATVAGTPLELPEHSAKFTVTLAGGNAKCAVPTQASYGLFATVRPSVLRVNGTGTANVTINAYSSIAASNAFACNIAKPAGLVDSTASREYADVCDVDTGLWKAVTDPVLCVPDECEFTVGDDDAPVNAKWSVISGGTAMAGTVKYAECDGGYTASGTAPYQQCLFNKDTASPGFTIVDRPNAAFACLLDVCKMPETSPFLTELLIRVQEVGATEFGAEQRLSQLLATPDLEFRLNTKFSVSCPAGFISSIPAPQILDCTDEDAVFDAFQKLQCYTQRCSDKDVPGLAANLQSEADYAFGDALESECPIVDDTFITDYSCRTDADGQPTWVGSYAFCVTKPQCDVLPAVSGASAVGLLGIYHATAKAGPVEAYTEFGAMASVTCKPGYGVNPAQAALTCDVVGTALSFPAVTAAVCVRTSCPTPDFSLRTDSLRFDSKVECVDGERNHDAGTVAVYECTDPLRTIVGPISTTCVGNTWATDIALSSCVVTKCAAELPRVSFAGITSPADVGLATTASCIDPNESFAITADENANDYTVRTQALPAICSFDGVSASWMAFNEDGALAPLPACVPNYCPLSTIEAELQRWPGAKVSPSADISFTNFNGGSGHTVAAGASIDYTCPAGATASPSSVTCNGPQSHGKRFAGGWAELPSCEYDECADEFPLTGRTVAATATEVGKQLIPACGTNFTVAAKPICTRHGWSVAAATPLCAPAQFCEALDNTARLLTQATAGLPDNSVGTIYGVKCATGSPAVGTASVVTCAASGTWTTIPSGLELPRCGSACRTHASVVFDGAKLTCATASGVLVDTVTSVVHSDIPATCGDDKAAFERYQCFDIPTEADFCASKPPTAPKSMIFVTNVVSTVTRLTAAFSCAGAGIPVNMPTFECRLQHNTVTGAFESHWVDVTPASAEPAYCYYAEDCPAFCTADADPEAFDVQVMYNKTSGDVHDAFIMVSCGADHHVLPGVESTFACVNGNWLQSGTHTPATDLVFTDICAKNACKPLVNSAFDFSMSDDGSSAFVTCSSLTTSSMLFQGEIVSSATITCDAASGNWADIPVCADFCKAPAALANGAVHPDVAFQGVSATSTGFARAGTRVFVECSAGYKAAAEISTCVSAASTHWTEPIACVLDAGYAADAGLRFIEDMTYEIVMERVGVTVALMTPSNDVCFAVFEDVTAERFGSEAICAVSVGGIRVRFSNDFTFALNDPVYVRGDVLFPASAGIAAASTGPFIPRAELRLRPVSLPNLVLAFFNGVATVPGPFELTVSPCKESKLSILTNNRVGGMVKVEFFATNPTAGSPPPAVASAVKFVELLNAKAALADVGGWAGSSAPIGLTISPAEVSEIFGVNAQTHTIFFRATNVFGKQTNVRAINVGVPTSSVAAKAAVDSISVFPGETFVLGAYLASGCGQSADATRFTWSDVDGQVGLGSSLTLSLPAPVVSKEYTVSITYKLNGLAVATPVQTIVTVEVKQPAAIAVIDGPSYPSAGADSPANFDSVGSFFHNINDRSGALRLNGLQSFVEGSSAAVTHKWKCDMLIIQDGVDIDLVPLEAPHKRIDCNVRAYGQQFTQMGGVIAVSNADLAVLFNRQAEVRIVYTLEVTAPDATKSSSEVLVRLIDSAEHYRVSYVTPTVADNSRRVSKMASMGEVSSKYMVNAGETVTLTAVTTAPDANFATFWYCDGIDLARYASVATNSPTLTIQGAAFVVGFDYECRFSILSGTTVAPNDRTLVEYDGRAAHYSYVNLIVNHAPYVQVDYFFSDAALSVTASDADGDDMMYNYYLQRGSAKIALATSTAQSQLYVPLAAGNFTFVIEVADVHGAVTSVQHVVAVTANPAALEAGAAAVDTGAAPVYAAAAAAIGASAQSFIQDALITAEERVGDNSDAAQTWREQTLAAMIDGEASFSGLEGPRTHGSSAAIEVAAAIVGAGDATTKPTGAARAAALSIQLSHLHSLAISGVASSSAASSAVETFAKVVAEAGPDSNVTEITTAMRTFAKELPYVVNALLSSSTVNTGAVVAKSGDVSVTATRYSLAAAQAYFGASERAISVSSDFFQALAALGRSSVDVAEVSVSDALFVASVGSTSEINAISALSGLSFFDGYTQLDTSAISRVLVTVQHPAGLSSEIHNYKTCQYLDEQSSGLGSEDLAWGTQGCLVDSSSATTTVCRCSHLTLFRVRAGYEGYVANGWLELTNNNIDNNRSPVYVVLVWAAVAIVLVVLAAIADRKKKQTGLQLLIAQWSSGETPKSGYKPVQSAHCSNAVIKVKMLLAEYHLFFSAFVRSPLSNIGGATRMFASTLVLLTGFAVTAMFWGGRQARDDIDNYGGVMFLGALVMIGSSLILHLILSKTRSFSLKDFLYTYAFEVAQLYHTGASDYFTPAECAPLQSRADAAQASTYAQIMNAAVIGNEAELHTLLRQAIVVDEVHAVKKFESTGTPLNAGAYFSYGFLIAWLFAMAIIICAFGIQLGNTVSTTTGRWIGSAFATIAVEMFAVKPFLFFVYSLFAMTCSSSPADVGAYQEESVLTAYEKLKSYVPPASAEAGQEEPLETHQAGYGAVEEDHVATV